MAPHWMLWALLFKFSEKIGSDIPGKSSSNGSDRQVSAVSLNPNGLPLFTTKEEHEIELFQPVCDDVFNTTEKYWTSSAVAASEIANISRDTMSMEEEMSIKSLDRRNTEDLSALTYVTSLSLMLPCVDRSEHRGRDLLLTDDASFSQKARLTDLLILRNPQQAEHSNGTRGVRKIVSELSMAPGYLSHDSESHLIYASYDRGSRRADEDLTLVDLMSYLISLTSGRQFLLVYDDLTLGVEGVVRTFQDAMGDTILIPYEPSILLLKDVLRSSSYHVQPMRNAFVLCSPNHVLGLFEQVRENVLESPTIRWFVIVNKDLTEELPLVMREGTQVALVQRLPKGKARLLSSRVSRDGRMRFHQAGWWSMNDARQSRSHLLKDRLVPDIQQLYSDFQGRQLLVTTNDNWPYFKVETLENGTVLPVAGIDHNVIKAVSEKLNFTYQLVLPPDGKWGGPQPDGSITGLIGMVARHEAHATLCELTITEIRETVVDFTMPYYLETMTVIAPAPKEKNRSFAVLSPFTYEVWLSVSLATAVIGPLLFLVTRLLVASLGEEDDAHFSLQSLSFNMYRNLVIQGNLIESRRWSLRFIFFGWYLFCFYIYAVYSGTLTAALAVIAYEKPIDSLYDLAEAHRNGYTIGTVRGTNYEATFKNAKSGIFHEVWQLFNHEDRDKSFVPATYIAYEMIMEQRFVLITAQLNSRLKTTQMGREHFYFGRETFLPQGYGIACSTGSPFRNTFSNVLIRLTEVGLVNKWIDTEVNKVFRYTSTSSDSGPTAITLQHVQAALLIVLLGVTISIFVFFLEIMIGYRRQRTMTAA